ncbi:hypothetical protein FQR65_LT14083 [Abscondita terminalis]|nr:hypothetical protein FQR65_LT14083 [Abscondita terminalis]
MSTEPDHAAESHIDKVTVKAPPFCKTDPKLWFIQLEAQFELNNIKSDKTKCNYVVSAIETQVLSQIAEFILDPPTAGKYDALKTKLVEIHSDSNSRKLKRLISELELGDKRPSQLLSEMARLGGTSLPKDLLKTLWLQRLPPHIQSILATSTDSVDKVAEMADKIAEIEQPQTCTVTVPQPDKTSELLNQLIKEVAELKAARGPKYSSHRSRSKSRPRHTETDTCWYHKTFKEKSNKCVAPWKRLNGEGSASPPVINALLDSFVEQNNLSFRLVVKDPMTNLVFLIDTGADVSLIPKNCINKKLEPSGPQMYAANNSIINTYGSKQLQLSLNLRRIYSWAFLIADVDKAIIGADFLHKNNILVDLRNKKFQRDPTNL